MRYGMDIASEVDHTVSGDLHLYAVAAHGESTIYKLGGHFISSGQRNQRTLTTPAPHHAHRILSSRSRRSGRE